MIDLNEALREFDSTEANLVRLEKIGEVLLKNDPIKIAFDVKPVYEEACRSYENLLEGLPLIDGWRPTVLP